MAGDWFRRFVNEEPEGGACFHQGEGLLVAIVESGGLVPVKDPFLDFLHVFLRRGIRASSGCLWWEFSGWAFARSNDLGLGGRGGVDASGCVVAHLWEVRSDDAEVSTGAFREEHPGHPFCHVGQLSGVVGRA